jgi:hypothetical protein
MSDGEHAAVNAVQAAGGDALTNGVPSMVAMLTHGV